jgi:hypothetical protein
MGCGNEAKPNGRNPEAPLNELGDLRCFASNEVGTPEKVRSSAAQLV